MHFTATTRHLTSAVMKKLSSYEIYNSMAEGKRCLTAHARICIFVFYSPNLLPVLSVKTALSTRDVYAMSTHRDIWTTLGRLCTDIACARGEYHTHFIGYIT